MVLLGMGSGKNYPNLLAMLEDNIVDPRQAEQGTHLVVFEVHGGAVDIIGQGLKVSCDGQYLVLGLLPDDYETDELTGVPLLGTGGIVAADPDDRTEQSIQIEGRSVADGAAYKRWNARRGHDR